MGERHACQEVPLQWCIQQGAFSLCPSPPLGSEGESEPVMGRLVLEGAGVRASLGEVRRQDSSTPPAASHAGPRVQCSKQDLVALYIKNSLTLHPSIPPAGRASRAYTLRGSTLLVVVSLEPTHGRACRPRHATPLRPSLQPMHVPPRPPSHAALLRLSL